MSDTAQDLLVDLDTLTDDEVMNLAPEQIQALADHEDVEDAGEIQEDDPNPALDPVDDDSPSGDDPDPDKPTEPEPAAAESTDDDDDEDILDEDDELEFPADPAQAASPDGDKPPEGEDQAKTPTPEKQSPAPKAEEKGAKAAPDPKDPASVLSPDDQKAVDFYKEIIKPFKADGKETVVRSPQDAVRLMQQGVNYSRRMQEMKPLRAIQKMLETNGLDDPSKLNFLIDLQSGKPEAIQKLLKDHSIDPLDLDVSDATTYQATDYTADPKDTDFEEAIQTTMETPGGGELIQDIHKSWDNQSKEALRDQPAIFANLLEQKDSGVYGKIKTELEYQRSLGYLTDVPFLQAYHQVGQKMQDAGVFGSTETKEDPTHSNGMAQLQAKAPKTPTPAPDAKPIDTGPRKAAPPKNVQPNPNLSSKPARSAPTEDQNTNPDYSSMSDKDFMALGEPE